MGILNRLLAPQMQAHSPADDYWYQTKGAASLTGVSVTPETALTISTVFRCVSAIAQDISGMPLIVYQREDRGKSRARGHPLYELLHDRPNAWQTSFQWREMMMGHLLLRGNAYSLIQAGPRGFVDQLIPLNPARMKVEQLSNRRLKYTYRWENGQSEAYTQDEIFHLQGLSGDGIVGLSVVELARESFGLGLATEQYGARFFGQDASPGGVLQLDGTLSDDAARRLEKSWSQAHGGLAGSHRVAVLEQGTKWQQVGLSNEDAQFLSTRSFQIEETARWFGVPLHRIGHTEKATSWGTGIEQFNLGYIAYTLIPWLRRWEQAISKDLILAPDRFFAEFLLDHLLRGDITARYNAYRVAIVTGWMTRNEVREHENLNPAEGLDDYLVPQNMATIDEVGTIHPVNQSDSNPSTTGPSPGSGAAAKGTVDEVDTRICLIMLEAAARLVRKESLAVARAVKHHAGDNAGWEAWAKEFWSNHAVLIAEVLHLDGETARAYAARCQALHPEDLQLGADLRTTELAVLALGEVRDVATATR